MTNAAGISIAVDYALQFFFLAGDADHDADVDLDDFNILATNFGQSNRNFSQGDFNYDTLVNLDDFNILAGRFGVALGPDGGISQRTRFGQIPIRPSAKLRDRELAALLMEFV